MSAITPEAASTVRNPTLSNRVYKDECMYSFDTPLSPDGLYTSLTTFQSFGSQHVRADYRKHGHPLYLHQVHRRVRKKAAEATENGSGVAPTKLAIGVAGGFELGASPYDVVKRHTVVCFPGEFELPYPSNAIPDNVAAVVEDVLKRDGVEFVDNAAMAWEDDERKATKYADNLIQIPVDDEKKKLLADPANWKCDDSGMTTNIWLNLSTGHIGSGRKNWDGSGGTGAALKHYMETGELYPLAVKLGTINPDGADVYSYAKDENDMVIDPHLKAHLAHFGIDMARQEKTERTMMELLVELNAKYDFSKITESGADLVPLVGPGYVGLENLGNSCYMASVLQLIFTIPQVVKRYFKGAERILAKATLDDPTDDLLTMMTKVAEGLLSERFAQPIPIYEPLDDTAKEGELPTVVSPKQKTDEVSAFVRPFMFKRLIGKNHVEFSSARQQDASEFFQYFLEKLVAAEYRGAAERLMDEGESEDDFLSTASLFSFEVEERLECQQSNKSRYISRVENMLSLPIPVDMATNIQKYKEYEERTSKRQKMDTNGAKSDEEEPVKLNIPFASCLETFAKEEAIDDFLSPATSKKGVAMKRTRFRSFPEYLVVQLKKYSYDPVTLNPKKLDVVVPMPDVLDLSSLRTNGPVEGEQLLPENAEPDAGVDAMEIEEPPAAPQPDPAIVSKLMEMGFSENGCKRAALATNNAGTNEGMEWVLAHMNDPDFNNPLPSAAPAAPPAAAAPASASAGASSKKPVPQDALDSITAMGFSQTQAENALNATDYVVDRALEWLFNNPDTSAQPAAALAPVVTSMPTVPNEALQSLQSMGFTDKQATAALLANNNAVERAVEWLFGQTDGLDEAVEKVLAGNAAVNEAPAKEIGKKHLDGEGKYRLMGFASHIGSSPNCGHYVAHIRKDGQFALFNDGKVAVSQKPPTDLGFLYFYRRAS